MIRRVRELVAAEAREDAEARIRARLSDLGATRIEFVVDAYRDGTVEVTGLGETHA